MGTISANHLVKDKKISPTDDGKTSQERTARPWTKGLDGKSLRLALNSINYLMLKSDNSQQRVSLFKLAGSLAFEITEKNMIDEDHCHRMGVISIKAEEWISAMSWIDLAVRKNLRFTIDEFLSSRIINGLCKIGHWKKALDFCDRTIPDRVINERHYLNVIRGCFMAGEKVEALQCLEHMLIRKVTPSPWTINTILNWYCKKGGWLQALSCFDLTFQIKPSMLDSISFSIAVDAACNIGDDFRAMKILKDMKTKSINPTIQTYSSLLDVFVKKGKEKMIHQILKEMQEENMEFDLVTINIILKFFAKTGNLVKVFEIMEKAKERGISLDLYSYSEYLKCLVNCNKIDNAMDVLLSLPLSPNDYSVNIVLKGVLKAKDFKKAKELLDFMSSRKIIPHRSTYRILLNAFYSFGSKDYFKRAAKNLLASPRKKIHFLSFFESRNDAINYFLQDSSPAEALFEVNASDKGICAFIDLLRSYGFYPGKVFFVSIIKEILKKGRWKYAENLIATSPWVYSFTVSEYNQFLETCKEVGKKNFNENEYISFVNFVKKRLHTKSNANRSLSRLQDSDEKIRQDSKSNHEKKKHPNIL